MDVLRDLLVILILLLDKLLFGAPPPGDLEKHATEILVAMARRRDEVGRGPIAARARLTALA